MTEQTIGQLVPHASSGLLVSLSTGRIFDRDGSEVGIQTSDTYVRVIRRQTAAHTRVTWYAHRLVWEAAHGPIPEGMQIDHLDSNAGNNALPNLDLVTPQENRARQARKNLALYGCRSPYCKLTPDQASAIRDSAGSIPAKVWVKRLGISLRTVNQVRSGQTWAHLPGKRAAKARRKKP
ncbi:HNH endonuclease signature motif containing protein [Stenotrophomonas maltophilia]|uniref:HNH endonuclease signature motif containing protein n=1 Tax=Stenotrophomonas maltophilia TaxID=40324 RepID=UPI0015DC342D|nr:HNH endonuclease [Stenotrophomonas maltophilia]